MELTELRYEVADRIATIRLHRPERLNAFTPTMADELVRVTAAADADDEVRVVVVTGSGRGFCAGADLGAGADTFADRLTRYRPPTLREDIAGYPRDAGGVVSLAFAALRKPVIAAINGPAVGVGATMTLPMDVRIAAESARFGFVFGRVGIVPEAASSWFLPRVVGISQAMEWVATGRVFDAAEALRGGLVSRVVPDDELLPTAYALAREIVANTSGVAVAAARQLLWSMLGASSPWDAHRADSRAIVELGGGPDSAEGVAAFLEKRPAHFTAPLGDGPIAGVPRWPAPPPDVRPGDRPAEARRQAWRSFRTVAGSRWVSSVSPRSRMCCTCSGVSWSNRCVRTLSTCTGAAASSAANPSVVRTASWPRPSSGQTCRCTQPRSSSRETAWESRLREERQRSASSLIRIRRSGVSESATRIS